MYLLIFIFDLLTLFNRFYLLLKEKICSRPRIFTMADVEEHKSDRWVIIDDDIYCLASMRNHSGGLDIIIELAGKDITRIFHQVHLASNINKQSLDRKYWIGKIDHNSKCKEQTYFLKENLIFHKTMTACTVPRLITIEEECAMKEQFKKHVAKSSFPCLNAKIALKRNAFHFNLYDTLATEDTTHLLWHNLIKFIDYQSLLWKQNHMLTTYVACFRTPKNMSEDAFEILLWKQLRLLHMEDVKNGQKWATNYSDNPLDPHFGFSVGKRAFFIVGLHPNSSRKARQFLTPAIVFNSHDQFTNLRRLDMITEMRQVIRNNDQCYNGSINPNLIPNDENSVAFEYSGKRIQPGWTPDFKSLHEK